MNQIIEIWEPRYKDRIALVAKYKVDKVEGDVVKIQFTKAKFIGQGIYEVQKSQITKWPIDSNGKIKCYAVPLDLIIGEQKDASGAV